MILFCQKIFPVSGIFRIFPDFFPDFYFNLQIIVTMQISCLNDSQIWYDVFLSIFPFSGFSRIYPDFSWIHSNLQISVFSIIFLDWNLRLLLKYDLMIVFARNGFDFRIFPDFFPDFYFNLEIIVLMQISILNDSQIWYDVFLYLLSEFFRIFPDLSGFISNSF